MVPFTEVPDRISCTSKGQFNSSAATKHHLLLLCLMETIICYYRSAHDFKKSSFILPCLENASGVYNVKICI